MKTDTDQLLSLIKNVPVYSISDICENIKDIYNITNGMAFLKLISQIELYVPTGTVFRVRGLELLLQRTYILIISGTSVTGNIVVAVDKAALDLECELYRHVPTLVGNVKSISFPNINKPRTVLKINEIVANYKDMVTKIRSGVISADNVKHTLLNNIFEFATSGKVYTLMDEETFD